VCLAVFSTRLGLQFAWDGMDIAVGFCLVDCGFSYEGYFLLIFWVLLGWVGYIDFCVDVTWLGKSPYL
jgi:hypothetical protein